LQGSRILGGPEISRIVGELNEIRKMLTGLLDSVEGELALSKAAAKG
jgi:hypothetical protein